MTKEELEKEIKNYIDENCNQWETDGLTVDDIVRIAVLDFCRAKRKADKDRRRADKSLAETERGTDRQSKRT